MKGLGFLIHYIVVQPTENYDSGLMYQLSSCATGRAPGSL